MYQHIASFLPRESQSQIRRVSSTFRGFPINPRHCCLLPNKYEVADWLIWKSRDLIREDLSTIIIRFYHDEPDQEKLITFNPGTAKLKGLVVQVKHEPVGFKVLNQVELGSREDILEFINGSQLWLDLADSIPLRMVRQILSGREICIRHGVSSDKCYLQLLENLLMGTITPSNIRWPIHDFSKFLKPESTRKLEDDFARTFNDTILPSIRGVVQRPELNLQPVLKWIENLFAQLTPEDLIQNYK